MPPIEIAANPPEAFPWTSAEPEDSHGILLPAVLEILGRRVGPRMDRRVLDVGAGNGSLSAVLVQKGYHVLAVEPSSAGVAQARANFPFMEFHEGDGYEDLAARFGLFDAIVSCEVIEHLLTPGKFLARARAALKPDAVLITTTPYHGYLKNALISLLGKWDFHHHPGREYGHVKFFSRATLNELASANGLKEVEFWRVGRIPPLAKSMVSVFERA